MQAPVSSGFSLIALLLEPPGNIARDIAVYRRALFYLSHDPGFLAMPEAVYLAFFAGSLKPELREQVAHGLSKAWEGLEGTFRIGRTCYEGGSSILSLEGPLAELKSRCLSHMAGLGFTSSERKPISTGQGIFLCRHNSLDYGGEPLPEVAKNSGLRLNPIQGASFWDSSLVLLKAGFSSSELEGASWEEFLRVRRRGLREGR